MFGIGELSRRSGFSAKTLRYYDEIGLLVPRWRHPVSGFRRYGVEAVADLVIIHSAKRAGLQLEEIRKLLAAFQTPRPAAKVRAILDRHRAGLEKRIRALRELKTLLKRYRAR